MQAIKIRPDLYWLGAIDWAMRSFHGYATSRGSSYNAYLILDDKITLIDTVKRPFAGELLDRIASVIDPARIDYIVSNHAEPDHSGSIPLLLSHCPHAKVYTSDPQGHKALAARYGDLPYEAVKTGDTLSLGRRTLHFVATPMLHWPDSMVTYCPEEKILFSNDAFGQHLASNRLFDDENDLSVVMAEAKKYYANILMLYGRQAQTALKTVRTLDLDMIAVGHGVLWRSHIEDILAAYEKWSEGVLEERAVVVFDSMWGSTEKLARAITDAFTARKIPVAYFDLRVDEISDAITEILTSKYLAVGSPTLNNQMMPNIAAFLSYLKGFVPKERQAFAFGSYGWGGQSVAQVEAELRAAGCDICRPMVRIANVPTPEQLAALHTEIQTL